MAEKLIHELATIVAQSPTDYIAVSDGTTTFKEAKNQWRYDLLGRTAADPLAVEGSIRHPQYTPSSGIGHNVNSLGRSGGIAWYDGTNWQALLDGRDMGRVVYRRINAATTPTYTLVAADVQYGIMIIYAGTAAKTITVPVMTQTEVPTVGTVASGAIGVARRIEILQTSAGAITLVQGPGLTLYGTTVSTGDNKRLILQYDNTTEARAWLL